MKKHYFTILALILLSFSCTDDEETFLNECQQIAPAFFEVYDPYRAYIDLYDERVKSGQADGTNAAWEDYLFNDPEKRAQKVLDFVDENRHRCEDLKRWGRGGMNPYRN